MSGYRVVIVPGQVITLQATFTDSVTGALKDPTTVKLNVNRTDAFGRYVSEVYSWAGVDTAYVERVSEGVFRGLYPVVEGAGTFSMNMVGEGAAEGAHEPVYYLTL